MLLWVRLLLPGVVKRVYNMQSKQLKLPAVKINRQCSMLIRNLPIVITLILPKMANEMDMVRRYYFTTLKAFELQYY